MAPATQDPSAANHPTHTLRIFAGADRGMAMGHIGGKVAFVPFAAPGDLVEVEVVREKRNYVQTRLLRVVEPSPRRRSPPCPHFGVCGGCQWQHLPYADQVAIKAQSFRGLLRSRLGLNGEGLFRAPLAAPDEWGYRGRVALKVRQVGTRVLVGFFARGTHRIVPLEHCPVADRAIGALLGPLGSFLQTFPPAHGALPQVDLQVDADDRVWAVCHLLRLLKELEALSLGEFLERACLAGLTLQSGRKATARPLEAGPARPTYRVRCGARSLVLEVAPGAFVQANAAVNQALVDQVVELAALYSGNVAVDLYCGAGNFTLPLAAAAATVVGIEGFPPAARDAETNARRNGLDNVTVWNLSAAAGLERLHADGLRPAFVLLDPPREGAAESMAPLADLAPPHILYISCAPSTLARDLKLLLARGYRVEWTRIADMFPQTAHIESLTLLSRTL